MRESTRFGRNVNNQCERFALFTLAHNFLTAHRAHRQGQQVTHTQVAGLPQEHLEAMLHRVFTRRVFPSRQRLSGANASLFTRSRRTPLAPGTERVPQYVLA